MRSRKKIPLYFLYRPFFSDDRLDPFYHLVNEMTAYMYIYTYGRPGRLHANSFHVYTVHCRHSIWKKIDDHLFSFYATNFLLSGRGIASYRGPNRCRFYRLFWHRKNYSCLLLYLLNRGQILIETTRTCLVCKLEY